MVWAKFLNQKGNDVALEKDNAGNLFAKSLKEVSCIEIGLDPAPVDKGGLRNTSFHQLATILKGTNRKLRSIEILEHEPKDLDYLATLMNATQHTDELCIEFMNDEDDLQDGGDAACCCLMNGLLLDGPNKLVFNLYGKEITAHQAELLFGRGIAQSSCLKTLELWSCDFDDPKVHHAVASGLKQNRSLEKLSIYDCTFQSVSEIFRAAIIDAKVRSIEVYRSNFELGIALDVLSSKDCRLESLTVGSANVLEDDWVDQYPTETNTSVKEVNLGHFALKPSQLAGICAKFKSMESLQLNHVPCQDITPLDTLLIGNDRKLQHLSLESCNIGEDSIIDFFRKIPQMKYIRRIDLNGNPFLQSKEWMNVLADAVQRNATLESISFGRHTRRTSAEHARLCSRLEVAFSVNRAWRRYMENDITPAATESNSTALPTNLWPLVLERALKISYFSCEESDGPPTLTSLRADAVFWLVRETMAAEAILKP